MGEIVGTPIIIPTVANMKPGEKGTIDEIDIVITNRGELWINLDAKVYADIKTLEEQYHPTNSDDENNEGSFFEEYYVDEIIPIERISLDNNGYKIDIEGRQVPSIIDIEERFISPTNSKLYTTLEGYTYIYIWKIPNFQNMLKETLIAPESTKKGITLHQFSELSEPEQLKLDKKNLQQLLQKATEKEEYNLCAHIKQTLQKKEILKQT